MLDSSQQQLNIFAEPLDECSCKPMTGWFRDGRCATDATDYGRHVVCVQVTREFLDFTKARGNNLSDPNPAVGFPGLKPGDHWCLCALRWAEALHAGVAPKVRLQATHQKALEVIDIADLKAHALDLPAIN